MNAEAESLVGRDASRQKRPIDLTSHSQIILQPLDVCLLHALEAQVRGGTTQQDLVLDLPIAASAGDLTILLDAMESLLKAIELGRRAGFHQRRLGKPLQKAFTSLAKQGVEEINQKGIIVRDVTSGLVDFPSLRDGQEVFLCWFKGEARIEYWHGTNEGIGSRKPL